MPMGKGTYKKPGRPKKKKKNGMCSWLLTYLLI